MSDTAAQPPKTPTRPIRVPIVMWDAYGRVTRRLDTDRSARLLEHMAADIREHGDEQDIADLERGLQELAQRRARMHQGRPRKAQG